MKYLLSLILILPGLAVALPKIPPIPVTLAYVEGEGAVGVQRAEQIFDIGMGVMRMAGIPVYRAKTLWFSEVTRECDSLAIEDRVTCLHQWVSLLRAQRGGLVYVALPPLLDRYMAGIANGICQISKPTALAVGNMRFLDSLDIRGYWMSFIAVIHELGHLVGMTHIDSSCNAMRSNALVCVDSKKMPLRYSSLSVADAKLCMSYRLNPGSWRRARVAHGPVIEEVRK